MNNINKTYESIPNSKIFDRPRYILRIPTPKMGLIDTKTVDSPANVINKVESNNNDLELIHTLLTIIVVIMCTNCFYILYKLHNKCLKKKYMSQAIDLDKILKKYLAHTTLIEK